MRFSKLVPNIFYTDIQVGLNLFIDCLEFKNGYNNLESVNPSCIAEKDGLGIFIIQSKEFAEKDRPELRLQTDNIDEVFTKVKSNYPALLHPNSKIVSNKLWGAKEFAVLDQSGSVLLSNSGHNKKFHPKLTGDLEFASLLANK